MELRADLLIVGAGMVGSALALALQGSGLQVLLLDGSPMSVKPFDPQAAFEPRVSALSTASQRILDRLGVWDGITTRRASPYTDMHVWDGSGTAGRFIFPPPACTPRRLGTSLKIAWCRTRCWIGCMTATWACWPMPGWNRCVAPAMIGC